MEFFTIGVYNSTEEDFFNKLKENRIDTFCDIRQRRGVRGSKYAFVNSQRLQNKLSELDIKYGHELGLAPLPEIRELQKKADLGNKELKTERQCLGDVFISEYTNRILNKFDFNNLFEKLDQNGASRVVFFCVEETAKACHRSLVTDRLYSEFKYKVTHL